MLTILAASYIIGVILIAGFWGVVLWRTNGFQGFADLANHLTGLKKEYTSNEVQWIMVMTTMVWPLIPLLFIRR